MSREIKRVPLDFAHTGTWPGYVDPDDHYDPPTGDGWQVWEDTSEGSPISPAFVERDSLVAWISEHQDCAPAAADAFITQGWAPSFILHQPFGIFTGVQIAAGLGTAIEWGHIKRGDYTTVAPDTPVQHVETGITGTVVGRLPPPNEDYYIVTWHRALLVLLAEDPTVNPNEPMTAGCRRDGFEVLPSTQEVGDDD